MKTTKHIAISMTQQQHSRAVELANKLEIPLSRIVNILINLTDDNQVLQDLLLKLNSLPGECTSEETHITIYRLTEIADEALYKIGQEIKDRLKFELDPNWRDYHERLERMKRIARTKVYDLGEGEY